MTGQDVRTPFPHNLGHGDIALAEYAFQHSQAAMPDIPVCLCDRWALVRAVLGSRMHGRHLYDDLSDIYAAALRDATGSELFAAYELAGLQGWFYVVLHRTNLCRSYVRQWVTASTDHWRRLMADKDRACLTWRRNPGVLSPYQGNPRSSAWHN